MVRSVPLFKIAAQTTNSPQGLVSGALGRTKILKHLAINNSAGSIRIARLYLNGTTSGHRIMAISVPADGSVSLTDLFIVLENGDQLLGDQNGAGITMSGWGANLEGAAS